MLYDNFKTHGHLTAIFWITLFSSVPTQNVVLLITEPLKEASVINILFKTSHPFDADIESSCAGTNIKGLAIRPKRYDEQTGEYEETPNKVSTSKIFLLMWYL